MEDQQNVQQVTRQPCGSDGRVACTMSRRNAPRLKGKKYLLTWSQTGEATLDDWTREMAKYDCDYKIYCHEDHSDSTGKHFHAVVLLKKQLNTTNMDYFNILGFHADTKGLMHMKDVRNAIAYCKKDGKWKEEGERPEEIANTKRREKLNFIRTSTLNDCIDSGMFSISEIKNIPSIKFYMLPKWPTWQKRNVRWFYGPTGSGKTRAAIEDIVQNYVTDYCILSGDLKQFFIGYEGQRGVILDDLRPGSIRFEVLLRILDGYPCTVNVKGAHCEWLADTIYITAPTAPSEMYVYKTETGDTREWDHLDQLKRRIDQELQFPLEDTEEY